MIPNQNLKQQLDALYPDGYRCWVDEAGKPIMVIPYVPAILFTNITRKVGSKEKGNGKSR